jgi:glycosyltransferase involved in cell wall biosynthesis
VRLSVIIPVFNEKKTVLQILEKVKNTGLASEVIVVDDGSTDGTVKILRSLPSGPGVTVLFHAKNSGKGTVVKTALKKVTGDYVVIQDADLEYDPRDWQRLIQPVLDGKAIVVYGSRFTGEHLNLLFWHWFGNRFLSLVTNIFYNTTLSDMETGYKLIPTKLLKSLCLKENRFGFEPEVTSKILKRGIKIYEVPISYTGRDYSQGKKITWKDGIIAFWLLVKYRFLSK